MNSFKTVILAPTCGELPQFQWKTIHFSGELLFPLQRRCPRNVDLSHIKSIHFIIYMQWVTAHRLLYNGFTEIISHDTIINRKDYISNSKKITLQYAEKLSTDFPQQHFTFLASVGRKTQTPPIPGGLKSYSSQLTPLLRLLHYINILNM